MAYNASIPNANDLLSQSQGQIKDNFTAIGTMMAPIDVAPNGGFFKFPVGGVDPAAIAQTPLMYAKVGTSAESELFIQRETASAYPANQKIFQWTAYGTDTGFTGIATGWTILPSGLMLKWGKFTIAIGATTASNFIVGPGAFTTVFNVQLSFSKTGGTTMDGALLRSFTTTSITAENISNNNAVTAYYLVLGIL